MYSKNNGRMTVFCGEFTCHSTQECAGFHKSSRVKQCGGARHTVVFSKNSHVMEECKGKIEVLCLCGISVCTHGEWQTAVTQSTCTHCINNKWGK